MAAPHPVDEAEYAQLMAPLGPFERAPELAVAVSGGADSMALCLLAEEWARKRGGRALALTVDHGLRPESAAEAVTVAAWLAPRDIEHRVLSWRGEKPSTGRAAAARAARYRLLGAECRACGILHLLVGHHLEDQAETFVFRLGRGSGADGLAAMAAVSETADLRILRPLLSLPKARLAATLSARNQTWIEDPTNQDRAHARVRIRQAMPVLAARGRGPDALARLAGRMGDRRAARETAGAAFMAQVAVPHPAGFLWLDRDLLRAAPRPLGLHALRDALMTVAGAAYPPRGARLARLYSAMMGDRRFAARTLAGCRIASRKRGWLICRETAAADEVVAAVPGTSLLWDGRFLVKMSLAVPEKSGRLETEGTIRRLGVAGWTGLVAAMPALRRSPIPAMARPSLPALWAGGRVLSVPALGYRRGPEGAGNLPPEGAGSPEIEMIAHFPVRALSGPEFAGCLTAG